MSGVDPKELRSAVLGLVGASTAAQDQAEMMTDRELGLILLGKDPQGRRWTTIEIHEAGHRLIARPPLPETKTT